MISAWLTGFATAFSLILAIGAQNAFVLRQGILRQHVFVLVMFCAMSDAILITAGVLGFGALVTYWPGLPWVLAYAGAAFLLVYGFLRFWAAWQSEYVIQQGANANQLWRVLAIAAAFTWLNPHVYLDTVGLLGAISTNFVGEAKTSFAFGAITASFVFFFALGYGARFLSPYLQSERAWRILDILIGSVMWWLAFALVMHA